MKKTLFIFSLAFGLLCAVPAFAASQSFNSNLYYGLTNNTDVQALQQFLTAQDDYSGPITGNFFLLTQQAVKKFQQNNNITPASGYFGPLTRTAANNILSQQSGTSIQQQSSTATQGANSSQNSSAVANFEAARKAWILTSVGAVAASFYYTGAPTENNITVLNPTSAAAIFEKDAVTYTDAVQLSDENQMLTAAQNVVSDLNTVLYGDSDTVVAGISSFMSSQGNQYTAGISQAENNLAAAANAIINPEERAEAKNIVNLDVAEDNASSQEWSALDGMYSAYLNLFTAYKNDNGNYTALNADNRQYTSTEQNFRGEYLSEVSSAGAIQDQETAAYKNFQSGI